MRLVPLLPVLALVGYTTLSAHIAFAAGSEAEQAGATLFRDKGCAYCHGAATQGTQKGPSLINIRKTMKAAQIAHQIKNGGQKMPSFEDSVSAVELTQLIAYLRAKHRPLPAPPATPPAPVSAP